MNRTGYLGLQGWAGLRWHPVLVIGEMPKKYRIKAITLTKLAGQYRFINSGETALVPKHAIQWGD